MTQEQIEGNKMIAEFMGAYQDQYNKWFYKGYVNNIYFLGYEVVEFKYPTSWDWIIPAVNKFINETVPPTESKDINEYRDYCNRLHNLVTDYKILPVFNCLAKAIKWYNQTKQL